jgi:hypothetical protein
MEPKTDKWAADNADWSQINADLLKTGLTHVILNEVKNLPNRSWQRPFQGFFAPSLS